MSLLSLSDDVIQALAGKEVLVLGRIQKVVDSIVDDLTAAGVNAYSVSDPSRKLAFMKTIEAWAGNNPAMYKNVIRDVANYLSDAAQIASARTVLQNTWDWTASGYTILEMVHTGFWSAVRRAGLRTVGPDEVLRFFRVP